MDGRKKSVSDLPETAERQGPAAGDKMRGEVLAAAAGAQDTPPAQKHWSIAELYVRFGVMVVRDAGRLDFRLKAQGEDRLLFSAPDNKNGVDEAGSRLQDLVAAKEVELEKRFRVVFSKEGEPVDKQWVVKPDGTVERGDVIKARAPRLVELYGIEAALPHAAPSYLNEDGQPLKFAFLQDSYLKGIDANMLANFVDASPEGRPAVYFDPAGNSSGLATEADVKRFGYAQEQSIESTVVHELAHNTQKRLDLDHDKDLVQTFNRLGWVPYADPNTHETLWLIKTRSGDLYRIDDEKQNWILCDSKGQPLDKERTAVDQTEAERASAEAVRKEALVYPPTDYFRSPFELDAEALMLFRLNAARRAALLNDSPVLYRLAKEQDQKDIDKTYGANDNGSSKMIRNPDGELVANDAAASAMVAAFEARSKP